MVSAAGVIAAPEDTGAVVLMHRLLARGGTGRVMGAKTATSDGLVHGVLADGLRGAVGLRLVARVQ